MSSNGLDLGFFLKNEYGEKYLYSINRDTFQIKNSSSIYDRKYRNELMEENALFVILGTDSGLLLQYVLGQKKPSGSRFLFVEPREVINRIAEVVDLKNLPAHVDVVEPDAWEAVATERRIVDYFCIDGVKLLFSLGAMDGFLPEYRAVFNKVQQEMRMLKGWVSTSMDSLFFVRRKIENLSETVDSASCLRGSFAEKTAFVLGGGPSLDDAIPWLIENRDRIMIIAVSRVCERLKDVGLVPHVICSMDPQGLNLGVSRGMFHFSDQSLFAFVNQVSPSLPAQWPGKKVFMGKRFPWNTPLNDGFLAGPGPTVTNSAIHLAIEMGFRKIGLVGVDLCFSKEGYSHAQGSAERALGANLGEMGMVETYGGWKADTIPAYAVGIKVLSEQAEAAKKLGITIFNASLSAAKVASVDYLSPENLAPESECPAELLAQLIEEHSGESLTQKYYETLGELDRAEKRLEEIAGLCTRALACNAGLFGRNGKKGNFKYKKQMDEIEKRLNNEYGDFAGLIKTFGIKSFLRNTSVIGKKSTEWTDAEVESVGRSYYEAYRENARLLKRLIDDARGRIVCRIEEEKDQINWDQVLARWQKDGQPGRVHVWEAAHADRLAGLPVAVKAKFATLKENFCQQFSSSGAEHADKLKATIDYSLIPSKALLLFKTGEKEPLGRLAEGLLRTDNPQAHLYGLLARGYQAELEGDNSLAVQEYQKVLDTEDADRGSLESALSRILSLSLREKNLDDALLALDCLAALSPVYQPHYAELLRLSGDLEGAVKVYGDYLPKVPEDHASMLGLSRVYLQQGELDAAKMACDFVMKEHPDDPQAQNLLARINAARTAEEKCTST